MFTYSKGDYAWISSFTIAVAKKFQILREHTRHMHAVNVLVLAPSKKERYSIVFSQIPVYTEKIEKCNSVTSSASSTIFDSPLLDTGLSLKRRLDYVT